MSASPRPNQSKSRPKIPLEPLNSNVVNYLVWRYLQEAGFDMAATWLGKEWHREPHKLMPFAQHIRPRELVHMLQDSLFLDDIRCRGDRSRRRYFFGDDPGPEYSAPVYDIAGELLRREREALANGTSWKK